MAKIKVVADSTCDLTPQMQQRFDVSIIPLYVVLGERSLQDGVEVGLREIFEWSDAHDATPKTAAVNLEQAIEFLRPFAQQGRDIIAFTISQRMSASYQVMELAAREFPDRRIEVIDSKSLSAGIALQVLYAQDLADQGLGVAEIAARVRAMQDRVYTSFVVDTTLYLYRGGRCNALANIAASALKLKPKIAVVDGAMKPVALYRGRQPAVVAKYVDDLDDDLRHADPKRVFIVHTGMEPGVLEAVEARIRAYDRFEEIVTQTAGGVIASHAGPGTLGVLYVKGA